MIWLLVAVVLILLVIFKGFRKVCLILTILIVVLSIIIAAGLWVNQSYEKQSRIASRKLIPLDQIELIDLKLVGGNKIEGRVRNNSKIYTLTKIGLDITIHDVTTSSNGVSRDDIIGETKDEAISVSVPPGQLRDFNEYVWGVGSTQAKGKMQWNYKHLYNEADPLPQIKNASAVSLESMPDRKIQSALANSLGSQPTDVSKYKFEGHVSMIGGARILASEESPFAAYDKKIIEKMGSYWKYQGEKVGEVEVSFKLRENGQIADLRVVRHNVSSVLAGWCIQAIEKSSPFDPFPEPMRAMVGDSREGSITFVY